MSIICFICIGMFLECVRVYANGLGTVLHLPLCYVLIAKKWCCFFSRHFQIDKLSVRNRVNVVENREQVSDQTNGMTSTRIHTAGIFPTCKFNSFIWFIYSNRLEFSWFSDYTLDFASLIILTWMNRWIWIVNRMSKRSFSLFINIHCQIVGKSPNQKKFYDVHWKLKTR